MKQIIKILLLLSVLPLCGQNSAFMQDIERSVGYIQINKNVKNVFVYVDTSYPQNRITIQKIKTSENFAKMTNDTLIISNPRNKTANNESIISVYLNELPQGMDVLPNGECIFTVLKNMSSKQFSINAKENSKISICTVYEWIIDSLTINQERRSDIYFSKLSIGENFLLKTVNATLQANDENIKANVKSTILSHNSTIKIKGFTVE